MACGLTYYFDLYSPVQKMEEERTAHEQKLSKMEAEMRAVFQAKVQEKEQKLKHSEEEASVAMQNVWDGIQLYLSLFISLHTIALCSSQANEGSSRKATSRVGGEETPSRVWPTHHPRESSKEARLHLQQVMIYRLLSHRCYRYGNNNYTKHISGYPYSSHTLNNALLLSVQ